MLAKMTLTFLCILLLLSVHLSTLHAMKYKVVTDLYKTIQPLSRATLTTLTNLTCAMKCHQKGDVCKAFSFSPVSSSCVLGSIIVSSASTRDSREQLFWSEKLERVTQSCASVSFSLLSIGRTTACLSTNVTTASIMSYAKATVYCKSLRAHVVTVKTLEKLALISSHTQMVMWVGLAYNQSLGAWTWDDDGSLLDASLMAILFGRDLQTLQSYSQCVMYVPFSQLLSTTICDSPISNICELPVDN